MADKSKDLVFGSECALSLGGTPLFATGEGLKAEYEWSEPSEIGMIGTGRPANLGRQVSKKDVKGAITVQPSYAHANLILQQVFDETTGTFTPADAPEDIDVADIVIDRGNDVYTYADCWPAGLTIRGSENNPIEWVLDLLGRDETDAGSVGALTIPDRMLFSDASFSLASNAYFPVGFEFRWSYDFAERFHNSLTRSSVMARLPRLEVALTLDENADTWADLLDNAGTDTAIEDVVLAFANGSNTLTITVPQATVTNPSRTGDNSGVEARQQELVLRAWLKSGQTDIVSIAYA